MERELELLLLIAALALGFLMVPVVSAESAESSSFADGFGTEYDLYRIANVDQLRVMEGDISVPANFEGNVNATGENGSSIDVEDYYDEFLPLKEGNGTPKIQINPLEGEGQQLGELMNISGKGDGEVAVSGILVGSNELRSTPEGGLSTFGPNDEIEGNKFSIQGITGDFNMVMWDEEPEEIIFLVRKEPDISYAIQIEEENKIPYAVVYEEDLPEEYLDGGDEDDGGVLDGDEGGEGDGGGLPWLWIGLVVGVAVAVIVVLLSFMMMGGRDRR